MQRLYVPKRFVRGSIVIAVEGTSVDVWTVEAAFAGRPRVVRRWFQLVTKGAEATAIAKALVLLLEAGATDPINIRGVLDALGFSGPHLEGQSGNFSEPPQLPEV